MDNQLPLSTAYPPIHVNGGGGDRYFDALKKERPFQMSQHPWNSRNTTDNSLWELLQNPELQKLYVHHQQQLHAAEMFASFDTYNGVPFPFSKLNDAWKNCSISAIPSAPPASSPNRITSINLTSTAI